MKVAALSAIRSITAWGRSERQIAASKVKR